MKLPSLRSLRSCAGAAGLALACSAFSSLGQGLTPAQALARMEVAPGFEVKLFASEPDIRQPVAMYFDERGRMWVIQYLQYPSPAGLKPVKVDNYLRTTYDKAPEPPPKGEKGLDRITICQDTDGDGKADKFKDFVTGLNMATGLAIGHGGVFVLQTPYLLFYADQDRDDVPDGDPEVLLTGFGMEDSHAFANSLQWGPDGWLYGAHGSTVTAKIRGIEFQQGIWRYHPKTKAFELFSEGGGNTWGLDFNQDGEAIAGTNFGDVVGLHQVQGAYYLKNFGKHGELHNPYAFGYFGHIPFKGFQGGHVTSGGIIYRGALFPSEFKNTYIAANLLGNTVYWHKFTKDGSTYQGEQGGTLIDAKDPWFRPVDCALGPDGAVYIADWHDKRATHLDSKDTWDRSNGRIYRLAPKGAPGYKPFDLNERSTAELVTELGNPNNWYSREARRLLADRADRGISSVLQKLTLQRDDQQIALEAFWALAVTGDIWKETTPDYLNHYSPAVRAWAIRLLADESIITPRNGAEFLMLSKVEVNPMVRSQLACSIRRITNKELAVKIIFNLLENNSDAKDQHIPMLLWWALEPLLIQQPRTVIDQLKSASRWKTAMMRSTLLERIGRRLSSSKERADQITLARIYDLAPGREEIDILSTGVEKGLSGFASEEGEGEHPLIKTLASFWKEKETSQPLLRLNIRAGNEAASAQGLKQLNLAQGSEGDRIALIDALSGQKSEENLQTLLAVLNQPGPEGLKSAALNSLGKQNEPSVPDELLSTWAKSSGNLKRQIVGVLATRPQWGAALLKAIEAGKLPAKDVSLDQVAKLAQLDSPEIRQKTEKLWGRVRSETAQDKLNMQNQVKLLLRPSGTTGRDAKGDAKKGKEVYARACSVCHKLFNEGGAVGPDLTTADRKSLDSMVVNIVNPNGFIRPEYATYEVTTKDDQSITGIMVDSNPTSVTVLNATNQKQTFNRDQLKELKESNLSLMPEGLLEAMSEDEIADLFAYLQQ